MTDIVSKLIMDWHVAVGTFQIQSCKPKFPGRSISLTCKTVSILNYLVEMKHFNQLRSTAGLCLSELQLDTVKEKKSKILPSGRSTMPSFHMVCSNLDT